MTKIPKNNLWQRIESFKKNQLNCDKNNTNNVLSELNTEQSNNVSRKPTFTSTPIVVRNNKNKNFNQLLVIDEQNDGIEELGEDLNQSIVLSQDLSPIIKQNHKKRKMIIDESDDELDAIHSKSVDNSVTSDKTSVNYYLSHQLLKNECPIKAIELSELKRLNYELMCNICDILNTDRNSSKIDEFLVIQKRIINRIKGKSSPLTTHSIESPKRVRSESPDLLANMEALDDDIDDLLVNANHAQPSSSRSQGFCETPSQTPKKEHENNLSDNNVINAYNDNYNDLNDNPINNDMITDENNFDKNRRKTIQLTESESDLTNDKEITTKTHTQMYSEIVDLCDDSNDEIKCVDTNSSSGCSIEFQSIQNSNTDNNQISDNDIAIINDLDFEDWNYEEDEQFNGCEILEEFPKFQTNNDSLNDSREERIVEYDFNKTDDNLEVLNTSIEGKFVGVYKNNGTELSLKSDSFEHSSQMNDVFKKFFGLESYRHNQKEAINAALLKYDCLILMPTGGGKSLCYQLPAMLSNGVTIVISPLKSLILDQTQKMNSKRDGVAEALTGEVDSTKASLIYSELRSDNPEIKILFVTPEKISASSSLNTLFRSLYDRNMLSRFVIDEAHCVSQWGHDFRPDYQKLHILRKDYPETPIIAMTATATQRVRLDILNQLGIEKPSTKWFIQSFNRNNLKFEVRTKSKTTYDEILEMLKSEFNKKSGIIYCLSRKDCEYLAGRLDKEKVKAVAYHAGITDQKRKDIQEDWIKNRKYVICATIAFGMGIDKPDVRFVIHYSMPKSIEGYYQEVGRAGRDGLLSNCILYYNQSDMMRWKNLLAKTSNQKSFKIAQEYLYQAEHFCSNKAECRRVQLLRYFGEIYDSKHCIENFQSVCDNCSLKGEYKSIDMTDEVFGILQSIKTLVGPLGKKRNENIGFPLLIKIFNGASGLGDKYMCLPMFGKGMPYNRNDNERLFKNLIFLKYLNEDTIINSKRTYNAVSYARLGEKATNILDKKERFSFLVSKTNSKSNYSCGLLDIGSQSNYMMNVTNKRPNPWNDKPRRKPATSSAKASKSAYFKSKPASSYGIRTNTFISVPKKGKK